MPWRLARAWGDSPPRNSWTTCRLNSIECVRCLAMGFLLESPVQLADSQVPHLSTPRGALHLTRDPRPLVLFSLMLSRPHRRDSHPDGVLLWEAYKTTEGEVPLPPHAIVISRAHDSK